MLGKPKLATRGSGVLLGGFLGWLLPLAGALVAVSCHAAIQFDVFLGFEGVVPEASWFPVVCEVRNDGPAFTGTVEVTPAAYNQGQRRRLTTELPTGTLKRLVIPVFSATRGNSSWDVRLLDERGKVREERLGIPSAKQPASEAPVIGALARTPGGAPVLAPVLVKSSELQPAVARLQPPIFPDNPLVLEGMQCLYLNSEKASELTAAQVNAIHAWILTGGHLVIGVEQVADIEALGWLKDLYPCDLTGMRSLTSHIQFQHWITSTPWPGAGFAAGARAELYGDNPFADLPADLAFEQAPIQVATGRVRQGTAEIEGDEGPLMVSVERGWGRVTGLLFSPEREPFRSWKHLPEFWSRLASVPASWYRSSDFNAGGAWSTDGIFGAMIDSRQIHKLPVGWLLLLLLVYLVVIGPLDQYWLKRIGRPMLTWITFPCYVCLFSGLIYAIGYKLRSGESEWNELYVVDAFPMSDRAEFRGRTYLSIYSPSNQRFVLENRGAYATFRGEFAGTSGGAQTGERASVLQAGNGFTAMAFVPVWSSQLFVSDWWEPGELPLKTSVAPKENGVELRIENVTSRKFTNSMVVLGEMMVPVGDLQPGQTKVVGLTGQGTTIGDFVNRYASGFQQHVLSRQYAFSDKQAGRIDDLPGSSMALSFITQAVRSRQYQSGFVAPPSLDLSQATSYGTAVLLAWDSGFSPTRPLSTYSPRRKNRNTLWRIPVPVAAVKPLSRSDGPPVSPGFEDRQTAVAVHGENRRGTPARVHKVGAVAAL